MISYVELSEILNQNKEEEKQIQVEYWCTPPIWSALAQYIRYARDMQQD